MENKDNNERNETGWHYANDFNSTQFTDCCGLAAKVGSSCPGCGKRVIND